MALPIFYFRAASFQLENLMPTLMWMMPPRRCELSPGLLAQYWAGNQMPTFLWMMPRRREPSPGFLTQYWAEPHCLRGLSPGFLTQYWAENLTPTFSCG
ncbi:hypothetical protein M405DRAFT_855906 [Rhizopogon salebrosus TDB-379]|nr:hypothetical protein M405DRAFT_855906 [Rhizopogon salebrosus TDB-379]